MSATHTVRPPERRWHRRHVIRCFGQWAVTRYGIDNLTGPCNYEIDRPALGDPWWSNHMRGKWWVNPAEFDAALAFARQHFGIVVVEEPPMVERQFGEPRPIHAVAIGELVEDFLATLVRPQARKREAVTP